MKLFYITVSISLVAAILGGAAPAFVGAFALLTYYIHSGFIAWLAKKEFKDPQIPALTDRLTRLENELSLLRSNGTRRFP